MKSFRQDKKGQFVVIAALLIAIITLSLVAAITQVSLNSQEITSPPVNELLLGVTSDMQRALTTALSQYTYAHYMGQPVQPAYDTMANWKKALLTSYSGLNLQMNDEFIPDFNSTSWNSGDSRSAATIPYSIDVNAYGFRGWTGITAKYVNLHIFTSTINTSQSDQTSFVFQLNQSVTNGDQTEPIANLTPDLVIVGSYVVGQNIAPATDVKLEYLGNGNYKITFNEGINSNTKGVSITVQTPDDNIWISAYYYQDIALVFNTTEKNGPTTNLGTIQYLNKNFTDTEFDKNYSTTPSIHKEKYYLRYYPPTGYTFTGWSTNNTENIQIENASLAVTAVTVLGSGSITAIYEASQTPPTPPTTETVSLMLDSLSWNTTLPSHLGAIKFNGITYAILPQQLTVQSSSYQITYNPKDANYHFLYWQFSGNVASMSQQGQTMDIMVYGNGTITAVYMATTTNPVNPPYDGEWDSLFFDTKPVKGSLVPYYMWSQLDSHDVTHSSQGNLKQTSIITSPITCPTIKMADYINLTMYIRPTPPNSVKSLETIIGFTYNGLNYNIASCTFSPKATQLIYVASMDVSEVDFGFGKQVIPEGAYITVTNTITFVQDNGFNFVYCGADTPSRLDLY